MVDVVILSGGEGTRLSPVVSDRPKSMADINGRPFLDLLIEYVASFGCRRFIICTGYKSDYIEKYYDGGNISFELVFSRETMPLGTAGAIKNAENYIKTDTFFVFNGDSFCAANLEDFTCFHHKKSAFLSMVLVDTHDSANYGTVNLDNSNKIIRFHEKKSQHGSTVNAGIYIFQKDIFGQIPKNIKYSLERDLFPKLVGKEFYGFRTRERLIDIGTPQRYAFAKEYFKTISWAK